MEKSVKLVVHGIRIKKVDLVSELGISSSTVAKMTKGEFVSMSVLAKKCEKYDCDFGDIIHYQKD